MIGSLRIADIGTRKSLLLRVPKPGRVPGLASSNAGAGAMLTESIVPDLRLGRAFWFSAWESDAALDDFEVAGGRLLETFDQGWSTRLEPERIWERNNPVFGDVPPVADASATPGPRLVTTMSTTQIRSVPRFLRLSTAAEGQALGAPGMLWAMGFAKPPRKFATVSFWQSPADIARYAHGRSAGDGHRRAVEHEDAQRFFTQSLVLRSRLYRTRGQLEVDPVLSASVLSR